MSVDNSRSIRCLGLCRKAGRLYAGFDAVIDALKAGVAATAGADKSKRVYGVVLAADVSAKTEKEIVYYCGKFGVCMKKADFTMDDAAAILRKRVGVYGVDENFYKMI